MGKATMNAREAGDYIGVSYWKVLDMAKCGEVKHLRIGKRVMFRKESLDLYLLEKEQEASSMQEADDKLYGQLRKVR